MHQPLKPETNSHLSQGTPYHNPTNYVRIPQKRAIACTTCAKAKTKCNKAIPSCSRCIAKGLICEPRSTRRTSINHQRRSKKTRTLPKRYVTANSFSIANGKCPTRKAATAGKQQLIRTAAQGDVRIAEKCTPQTPELPTMSMRTPVQIYTPEIVNQAFSYSCSPDVHSSVYQPSLETSPIQHCGVLTPQTPESVVYPEPMPMIYATEQYTAPQVWPDEAQMPNGLGLENDLPELLPSNPHESAWYPEFPVQDSWQMSDHAAPVIHNLHSSTDMWPLPPHLPEARAISSHSLSECSVPELGSSFGTQGDWHYHQTFDSNMLNPSTVTFMHCMANFNTIPADSRTWEHGTFASSF